MRLRRLIFLAAVGCSLQLFAACAAADANRPVVLPATASPSAAAPTTAPRLDAHLAKVKVAPSEPNTAGGVDLEVAFRNSGTATIKYVYVTVDPYNAVGDVVASEIGDKTTATVRTTGPVEPGSYVARSARTVWYNATIDHVRVRGITIEYMDGSAVTIDGSSLTATPNGDLSDAQARVDPNAPTVDQREAAFIALLRSSSDRLASEVRKIAKVKNADLLTAGWRMCRHPDYDGVTIGDPLFVRLPKGVPEKARTWIWVGVTQALCPVQ